MSKVSGLGSDQNIREIIDQLDSENGFQKAGKEVANKLADAETAVFDAYTKLKNASTEQASREAEAEIQTANISYKRIQNAMELLQTLAKNSFEMMQRMVQNLALR